VVLGVGVARVRARGPLMMAWITYGGPDGADALGLAGGSLFSFYSRLDLLPPSPLTSVSLLRPHELVRGELDLGRRRQRQV